MQILITYKPLKLELTIQILWETHDSKQMDRLVSGHDKYEKLCGRIRFGRIINYIKNVPAKNYEPT